MGVVLKEKVYELATEGIHNLQIVEVKDLGLVESSNPAYKSKERVSIAIDVLDQKSKDGEKVQVFVNASQSVGPKSTLGKFLRNLGITNLTNGIDLDDLIGMRFQAVIEHNVSQQNGKTYANIGSIIKSRPASGTDEI